MDIINKIEFEGCFVGEVNSSTFNTSKEARIKAVTNIASICMGRLGFKETPISVFDGALKGNSKEEAISAARLRLYNRLLKESAGNPSTPFEFIPVRIDSKYIENIIIGKYNVSDEDIVNNIYKYGYTLKTDAWGVSEFLTNMRTLLKAGIKEEDIPFNTPEEIEGFKVVVAKQPKVSLDHLVRHRGFSFNVESSRNKKYLNEVEFHYPNSWNKGMLNYKRDVDKNKIDDELDLLGKNNYKPEDATKELSSRRLVLTVMAGWKKDSSTWDNLFKVRGKGTGTQSITGKVVNNIKELIYGKS